MTNEEKELLSRSLLRLYTGAMSRITVLPANHDKSMEFDGTASYIGGILTVKRSDGAVIAEFANGSHWWDTEPTEAARVVNERYQKLSHERLNIIKRIVSAEISENQWLAVEKALE